MWRALVSVAREKRKVGSVHDEPSRSYERIEK